MQLLHNCTLCAASCSGRRWVRVLALPARENQEAKKKDAFCALLRDPFCRRSSTCSCSSSSREASFLPAFCLLSVKEAVTYVKHCSSRPGHAGLGSLSEQLRNGSHYQSRKVKCNRCHAAAEWLLCTDQFLCAELSSCNASGLHAHARAADNKRICLATGKINAALHISD